MRSPVLVTAPATLPVTVDEAKAHLRVDGADDDTLIEALIEAAVSHLDGWTGILGRALVEQTWRMDFDDFTDSPMRLPLWPVNEITSITWRNEAGEIATIAASNYALRSDELGAYVHWDSDYTFPTGLYESAAVAVTFTAGYPTTEAVEADPEADPPVEAVPAASTVPPAIKAAILLLVGHWYRFRSAGSDAAVHEVPMAVDALITPFRRTRI